MKKILVFQHAGYKPYGTLNPLLKEKGLRLRYVNFDRDAEAKPSMEKYHGLVVFGSDKGVYESQKHEHIKTEMQVIEEALKKGVPILCICFGAQMLASVLGAEVRKSPVKEIGWHDVHLTEEGQKDALLSHFQSPEKVFQYHRDTFDIPQTATHLAYSDALPAQAFRYGEHAYGLQFHLEVNPLNISRCLQNEKNKNEMQEIHGESFEEKIKAHTHQHIARSMDLSQKTFSAFIDLFGFQKSIILGSDHGGKITTGDEFFRV
ncbi:MAG: type 1 glutamine amidotransferase [Candidatus Peregrinibacteria bacterium]